MGIRDVLSGRGRGEPPRDIELAGDPAVTVRVRRSAQARRLSLRISRIDGKVTLTMPQKVPLREAEVFALERADWIRGHLAGVPQELRPMPGDVIPFEGAMCEIVAADRRGVALADGQILVPRDGAERTPARLGAFFKQAARDRLVAASDHYAAEIGRSYGRITLRDTRSRWGSCTQEGNLMYSWRLVMAPRDVLSYVAAHEVSHLIHMDHSARFWAEVQGLFPGYQEQRDWLRESAGDLHRYRFRD